MRIPQEECVIDLQENPALAREHEIVALKRALAALT
jgi:hypothetical protein